MADETTLPFRRPSLSWQVVVDGSRSTTPRSRRGRKIAHDRKRRRQCRASPAPTRKRPDARLGEEEAAAFFTISKTPIPLERSNFPNLHPRPNDPDADSATVTFSTLFPDFLTKVHHFVERPGPGGRRVVFRWPSLRHFAFHARRPHDALQKVRRGRGDRDCYRLHWGLDLIDNRWGRPIWW